MEPNLAISLGSVLSVFGVFFAVNRDSKKQSAEMADLQARVRQLEAKAQSTEKALQELLTSIQEIKVTLVRIDTKLSNLEDN